MENTLNHMFALEAKKETNSVALEKLIDLTEEAKQTNKDTNHLIYNFLVQTHAHSCH